MQSRPTRKRIARKSSPAPASEHLVEKRLLNALRNRSGLIQFKKGVDGWPDRMLCYRGVLLGIEIKSERADHGPTKRQQQRLDQIRRAGGLVGVVRSKEELIALLAVVDTWYETTGGLPWSSPP